MRLITAMSAIALVLGSCSQTSEDPTHIKIGISGDPSSLDPRLTRELNPISVVRTLFEGLMRFNSDGELIPGIAESVEISPDGKTYTFRLKETVWSDGTPLTAFDFEYAWKKNLEPDFPSSNASMFYPIRGAQEAKLGKIPLQEVGITAQDKATLFVKLEAVTPYFLNLTALHAYFPVSQKVESGNAKWADPDSGSFVGNGPFMIEKWEQHNQISVKRNPRYWNAPSVKLSGVDFIVLEENTALQLFKTGSIDWAGSPLSTLPIDSLESLHQEGILESTTTIGTFWLRFNTTHPELKNENLRKALSYAINRKEIVEHITKGFQVPALGIVPPQMGLQPGGYFKDSDLEKAAELVKGEQLESLTLTLVYQNNDREHKIAQVLQQQWERHLPITIHLQALESKTFFSDVKELKYEIATGSWFADVSDPADFLNVFKTPNVSTNRTNWGNPEYTYLLEESNKQAEKEKRRELLISAESLLMEEMPVAPLFFFTFNYVKNPKVEGVLVSDLGFLDFAEADKKLSP